MTPRWDELGRAQRAALLLAVALLLYAIVEAAGVVAVLAAGIAILGFGPAVRQAADPEADAMSPHGLVPPLYAVFALAPYLVGDHAEELIRPYLLLQFLGLCGLRLGLALTDRVPSGPPWPAGIEEWEVAAKPLRTAAWVLLALAVPSLATYLVAMGGIGGILEVGYGGQRNLIIAESQLFGAGFEWALLGGGLLAFCGAKYGSRRDVLAGVAVLVPVSGLLLATGQRNPLAYGAMFGFALYHYGKRRLSARATLGLIVAGMVAAQLFSIARFFLDEGLATAIVAASGQALENPLLLAPWAAAQFTVPPASLIEILEHGPPPLLLGRSYLVALLTPLPFVHGIVFGNEPSISEWRMQTFYPDRAATGATYGFSPVTEAYMNFGTLGVPFALLLYGLAIGAIYRSVRTRPTPLGVLVLAGSVPMFMLNGFTNQASTLVYQWVRGYLMPAILLAVVLFVGRRRVRTPGGDPGIAVPAGPGSEGP